MGHAGSTFPKVSLVQLLCHLPWFFKVRACSHPLNQARPRGPHHWALCLKSPHALFFQVHTQISCRLSARSENCCQIDHEIWHITNLESLCPSLPGKWLKRKDKFFMHVGSGCPSPVWWGYMLILPRARLLVSQLPHLTPISGTQEWSTFLLIKWIQCIYVCIHIFKVPYSALALLLKKDCSLWV